VIHQVKKVVERCAVDHKLAVAAGTDQADMGKLLQVKRQQAGCDTQRFAQLPSGKALGAFPDQHAHDGETHGMRQCTEPLRNQSVIQSG